MKSLYNKQTSTLYLYGLAEVLFILNRIGMIGP